MDLVELWETQHKRTGKIPGDWEYEKLHDYLHREISAELNLPRRDKGDWSIREKLFYTIAFESDRLAPVAGGAILITGLIGQREHGALKGDRIFFRPCSSGNAGRTFAPALAR